MKERIYLSPPSIDENEIHHVTKALKSGWISSYGEYNELFREKLNNYFESKSLLTNSGTSAIHLALKCLHIQPNDYILCSNFTFAATAFPILYEKAIPVFIGIEKETWNISPIFLEEAIIYLQKKGKKPKALIIAYCYGHPAKMDEIESICIKYNIPIIEDAAEALGSEYKNKKLGSLGLMGIISFNGNKIITTSSGGLLISKNIENINYAEKISAQAKERTPYYLHNELGFNYLQSNILSSIGVAQLEKLEEKIAHRREVFENYFTKLKKISILNYQKEDQDMFANRWLSSFLFNEKIRIIIEEKLREKNIESRRLWNPLSKQKAFKNSLYFGDEIEYNFFEIGLSLPSGENITHKIQNKIINIILKAL